MPERDRTLDHYFSVRPKSEMKLGVIHTYLNGKSFRFLTASGVFSRKRVDSGTALLIESMVLPEEGYVLDVGCGYGAVGIAAAASNPELHVVMVDANLRAAWLAKQNIEINGVDNAEVRKGHLYKPVKDLSFNCILSNPPVSAGMETVRAIIAEAPDHMAKKAFFQMVVRSKIGGKRLRLILEGVFRNTKILSRKGGYRVFISEKE